MVTYAAEIATFGGKGGVLGELGDLHDRLVGGREELLRGGRDLGRGGQGGVDLHNSLGGSDSRHTEEKLRGVKHDKITVLESWNLVMAESRPAKKAE